MYIIKNGLVKTVINGDIQNGIVVIKKGKIEYVGDKMPTKTDGYEIIDANGAEVTPGLVDPHCHVGSWEEGIGWEGSDGNEMTDPVTPHVRGIDGVYYKDEAFLNAAKAGVTTVCTGPGSANVIGGTFCILKTYANSLDEATMVEESSMKMALGENPKRVYGSGKKVSPLTRMASAAIMRNWLEQAKEYLDAKTKGGDKQPKFNQRLESLSRVFKGMPVKIHAHREDDIETAMRIADQFKLDMTIEHATESHLITETIIKKGYSLIIGPTLGNKSKYELRNKTYATPMILEKAGIEFATMTDAPVMTIESTLLQAAMYVKAGASKDMILKAMTHNAAKLNKIDNRVGSLKKGMDADIVIWSDNMWNLYKDPSHVFVDGNLVK